MLEVVGGEPSDVVLAGAIPDADRIVDFPLSEVKRLTGLELPDYEIKLILRELGFWVSGNDKLVKVGAAWQVLLFLFALEVPFIQRAVDGTLDGTGDYGFDPLSLKSDRRAVTEIKNGRLAMIAFGGLLHQQLLTKTGTLAQLSNFQPIQ